MFIEYVVIQLAKLNASTIARTHWSAILILAQVPVVPQLSEASSTESINQEPDQLLVVFLAFQLKASAKIYVSLHQMQHHGFFRCHPDYLAMTIHWKCV